jgi:hypothetical protein
MTVEIVTELQRLLRRPNLGGGLLNRISGVEGPLEVEETRLHDKVP